MHVPEQELKGFIIDSGLVSRKDVAAAEEEAVRRNQSIGDILVAQGLITTDALRRLKAYVLGIPFVDLRNRRADLHILSHIPEPLARTHSVVAYNQDGDLLEVAVLDTGDLQAIEQVCAPAGLKIAPRLTDDASLRHMLVQYQRALKQAFGEHIATESERINAATPALTADTDRTHLAAEPSVARIVDTILRHAIMQRASDIHIEPLEHDVLIRYRINGVLHDAMTLQGAAGAGIAARIKALAHLEVAETKLPQDGRFKMEGNGEQVSFRASIVPTFYGEKVVMRLLRETGEGFTLDALGFHGTALERVHLATRQSSGLTLVAGLGMSGKTTTLYTLLDIVNTPDLNIATIEDPIEYQIRRINQTQVSTAAGLSFAAGLRAILRQDPDVVMVGEIRDAETASLAVHAALAGRRVFAGIHAKDTAHAIQRLLDFGVEPFALASALRLVIGQRIVRRLCAVREQVALTADERADIAPARSFTAVLTALTDEQLVPAGAKIDAVPFYRARSSPSCSDGYQGKVGVYEVLPVSATIRDLIVRGADDELIEAQAQKEGMLTLHEDALYTCARGLTSLEEVARLTTR